MTIACTKCGAFTASQCGCLPSVRSTHVPIDMPAGYVMSPPKRKVIQIAAIPCGTATNVVSTVNEAALFALCNDGTMWVLDSTTKGWEPFKPIPQDGDK